MKKPILLTGAEGFIGRGLLRELTQRGITVIKLPKGVDVSQEYCFSPFHSKNICAVIHLAALCSVPKSWESPLDYYKVNVMGTLHALEFCRSVGARLILPSSYMYGIPHYLPIDEEHPLEVNNPYAQSKMFSEETARFYARNYHVPVTILRLFNVYGPGQNSDFLIPSIVQQTIRADYLTLQSLTPRRDFVHLMDVIRAFILALENPQRSAYFNVGSGTSYSVEEIVKMVQFLAKTNKPVHSLQITRKNEIDNVIANCIKIKNALGWTAQVSILEGLSELVALERADYEQSVYSNQ